MSDMKNLKILAAGALLAAMTCVVTLVIKIPTPVMGYVHPGDCFVLLSGYMLGPAVGGISAGVGSMLSDLLGGYAAWAPGTFVIKYLSAYVAARIFESISRKHNKSLQIKSVVAGISGELVMITGYFLYDLIILELINTGTDTVSLGAAITQSATEIPFNAAQGLTGIALSTLMLPLMEKVNPVRARYR